MKYNALDCTSLDTEYSAGKKRKSESVKGVLSEKISKRRLLQSQSYCIANTTYMQTITQSSHNAIGREIKS